MKTNDVPDDVGPEIQPQPIPMSFSMRHASHVGLISALQDGASADIWYDANDFGDSIADSRIDITKRALEDAAAKLIALDALRGRLHRALSAGELTGPLAEDLSRLLDAVAPKNGQDGLAYSQVEIDSEGDAEVFSMPS